MNKPKIENYTIYTGMGKCHEPQKLPFLSFTEFLQFEEIGYSGKFEGNKISREQYLNSLGKGIFTVEQTMFDNGDSQETFHITRVVMPELNCMIMFITDHGDPSVGIFPQTWTIQCPFCKVDVDEEGLDFFRKEMQKLYGEFSEGGGVTCEYDFELRYPDYPDTIDDLIENTRNLND